MRSLPLLAVALALSATAAHADLKLVQTTRMDGELAKMGQNRAQQAGLSAPDNAATTTTYYKGNRMRTEAKGRITVFDGSRMLLLNEAKKTYQAIPSSSAAANPLLAMVEMKTDVTVKPSGKSKVIAGKLAKQYIMTMTMNVGIKPGVVPNKESSEGEGKATMPKIPPITSKTEIWTVEFAGIAPRISSLMEGFSSMPGMKEIQEKVKSIKGIGLETTMTQSVMGKTMTMHLTTISLSEASLPESLFAPPKGWKQVPYEAPSLSGGFGIPGLGRD